MPSEVKTKKKALEAAESLLSYPDTHVKSNAQVVANYLKGLPVGVDEFIQAIGPEGSAMARAEFRLSSILARRRLYVFKRPIKVTVAREEGYFVAWCDRFLVHSTGDTLEEALHNYMEEWQTHYQRLADEAEHLSPPLQKELATIRHLLVKEQDAA